jgi:hypothetical protein
MTSRTFNTWNPNACDPSLLLDQGNLVVTTGANALSTSRKVMGTLLKSTGRFNSEHEVWTVPMVNLGANVVLGVAQTDSPLNQAVGADSKSYGFVLGTGELKNNGSVITTLDIVNEPTTSILRNVISLYTVLDSGPWLIIAINGSERYMLSLPSGKTWGWAATLAGGNAGETSLYSNFGQRGFNFPIIQGPPA